MRWHRAPHLHNSVATVFDFLIGSTKFFMGRRPTLAGTIETFSWRDKSDAAAMRVSPAEA
jgi:hypothetical protein